MGRVAADRGSRSQANSSSAKAKAVSTNAVHPAENGSAGALVGAAGVQNGCFPGCRSVSGVDLEYVRPYYCPIPSAHLHAPS